MYVLAASAFASGQNGALCEELHERERVHLGTFMYVHDSGDGRAPKEGPQQKLCRHGEIVLVPKATTRSMMESEGGPRAAGAGINKYRFSATFYVHWSSSSLPAFMGAVGHPWYRQVGFPLARYGHGVGIIEQSEGNDKYFKRLYMYVYGGLSPQCGNGGVCNDVWRYDFCLIGGSYQEAGGRQEGLGCSPSSSTSYASRFRAALISPTPKTTLVPLEPKSRLAP